MSHFGMAKFSYRAFHFFFGRYEPSFGLMVKFGDLALKSLVSKFQVKSVARLTKFLQNAGKLWITGLNHLEYLSQ